jgi:hypothetical protein
MTLESLRERAKSLLRGIHARTPDAVERLYRFHPDWQRFYKQKLASVVKLADAQLVVARELGFASWPRLKAELDRGADVSEPPRSGNPYREIVERVARCSNMEIVRCGNILTSLPGRRPLENRGKPLPWAKLEALIGGLEHPSPKVRRFCLELLDKHPDPRAVPPVLACLEDEVPRVRWHAVHALGCDFCKVGTSFLDDEVQERLREVAESDPSEKVRKEARMHLERATPERSITSRRGD